MSSALHGIKVVDLTQGVSGPMSTRLLSQMGARVIKVERPQGGDLIRHWDDYVNGMCSGHVWVNPGKESIALNLRSEEGADILLRLLADADVVIENFVPGTLASWGLDDERLRAVKDDLIICHISGFGQTGPSADRAALDLIIQAESGLISTNGTEAEPAKLSVSVADISGSMYATISILECLYHRERTGEGQTIDLALFDAVMTWTGYFPYMAWYQGRNPGRVGLNHHTMFPYGVYQAGDGKGVVIAAGAGSHDQWRRFCEAMSLPELIDHPDYSSNGLRLQNKDELQKIVVDAMASQPQSYWLERFHEFGIPSGAYNEFDEALEHPRLKHRKLVKEIDSAVGPVKVFDFAPSFSTLDSVNELGPPLLGEHTDSILAEIGLDPEAIEKLRAGEIVV
ncbi:CaiB/BaiF CoA transferase family protein [Williamsia muralis]|uniref:Carnitine dehydratase n=1 Tax=Williamsia marianensis TaxID=85044 RepID=A0A2G3PN40_WILMA|nr:CaiB/BaiF CoA-transferase family protein [Williamsia marianensis]PHV67153.1 carnitine dehydratase [Williamsia marianensis]